MFEVPSGQQFDAARLTARGARLARSLDPRRQRRAHIADRLQRQ
jgi:hypothetical protein